MSADDKDFDFELLFEGVNSPADLLRKLETPAEREIVRRASVLRYFDKTIFSEFLSRNLPDGYSTPFEKFVTNFNLERASRTRDLYRVKEEARRAYLDELRSEHQAGGDAKRNNEAVFVGLLEYFERPDAAANDLDRLAVLVVTDPRRAEHEFERLYREADARFDLARCNDLLRTLESRLQLLDEGLRLLCQSRRQYYNARCLYAAEFYQTTTYLERSADAVELQRFLSPQVGGDGKWVYNVYATGGLGKTMFLRWLIARECVPRGIPVARLDFDQINLNTARQYPLLLLLPIAEQLDQQIPGRPFSEIFKPVWVFKPLLDIPAGGERDAGRAELERSFVSFEPSWRSTAISEFCRTLREAKFAGTIVVAIDTLEEMMLVSKESLCKVVQQVVDIHGEYPALRLVLSGRYDLREALCGLPEMHDLFEHEAINREVKRFSSEEARAYMSQRRGLNDDSLAEAIVQKCAAADERGQLNPFVLSLITDLVVSKDIKTVEDVKALPRAEVAYLIERIIKRIPDDDVRWMLRYASVPRRFTLDLLEKVLWNHLVAEREKRREQDSLRKGAGGYDQREYWKYGGASTPREAWDKLQKLASAYGWVWFESPDGSVMRLHSDVSVPMRLLLAAEDIYPQLHKDAALYFKEQAGQLKDDPSRWAEWTCESVYHRFQFEGRKAAQFWRERMKSRLATSDMEVRLRLASEITRRDYVDQKCRPLKWREGSDEPIVEPSDVCEAHHEAAVAAIMLTARHEPGSAEYSKAWGDARQHLLNMGAALESTGASDFKAKFDVEKFARLAQELNKSLLDPDVVRPLAEEALATTDSLYLELSITTQLAEMHARRDSAPDAERTWRYFNLALKYSRFLKSPALSPLTVTTKLARWCLDSGRYLEAISVSESVLKLSEVEKAPEQARQVKYMMARANTAMGRFNAAERLCREASGPDQYAPASDLDWDNQLLFFRLQVHDLLKPLDGLRRGEALLKAAGDEKKRRAALLELRGYALSLLMRFEEAATSLRDAEEIWNSVNDRQGPDRARMHQVELQLNVTGNASEAAKLLEDWDAHSEKKDAALACQMELLRVRCHMTMRREEEARKRWSALSECDDVKSNPRSLARTLAVGLACHFGGAEALDRLRDVLQKIEPASARLPLLAVFRSAQGEAGFDARQTVPLLRMVDATPEKKPHVFSGLMYAALLRFFGARDRAESTLAELARKALRDENSFAFNRALSALNRGGFTTTPDTSIYHSTFLHDYKDYPELRRAALLEEAERAIRGHQFEEGRSALDDAAAIALPLNVPTKWDALAMELTASLARHDGKREKADANLEVASSMYATLGDEQSAARIRSLQGPAQAKAAAKSQHGGARERVHLVRLDAQDGSLVVQHGDVKEPPYVHDSGEAQLLASALRDRGALYHLSEWIVDDFESFRSTLWKLLMPPPVSDRLLSADPEAQRIELRLEIPSANLAKIPWELARDPEGRDLRSRFRYVYRTAALAEARVNTARWIQLAARTLFKLSSLRVDGIIGPRTRQVLAEAGLSFDKFDTDEIVERFTGMLSPLTAGRPLRVLTITPSFEALVSAQRGAEGLEGGSLPHLYASMGWEIMSLEVGDKTDFREAAAHAVARHRPHVIHIESSFNASVRTGLVHLDFNVKPENYNQETHVGVVDTSSGHTQYSAVLLNQILSGLAAPSAPPLVVIESQNPPGRSAAVHQLLMRNTFASELFHLGNTCGVVAGGLLTDAAERRRARENFIESLTQGHSFGHAINASRTQTPALSLQHSRTAVLFANDPSLILLPD